MATETHKYADQGEREARHSALEEFGRDERRPAVLLLSALVLSAIFFAIGLMVGRWTAEPASRSNVASSGEASTSSAAASAPQPTPALATNTTNEDSTNAARRFALLVATYDAPEKAQPLIKTLQEAGYKDVRTTSPRAGETRPRYSVLIGHYTQDEAREAARQMRSAKDPRLKNARVIAEK
jgi:hypothetical protein